MYYFLMLQKMKFFKIIDRCLVDERKLYKLCSFIPSLMHLLKKLYEVLTMLSVGHCPRHSGHRNEDHSIYTDGFQSPYSMINAWNSKVMFSKSKISF